MPETIRIEYNVEYLHAMSNVSFSQQPLPLFQICAKILWKTKPTENCIYCWLTSCHLARFYTQIIPIDINVAQFEITQFHPYVDNTSEQPKTNLVNLPIVVYTEEVMPELGSNFVLNCNRSIVKNFMLLHCLYSEHKMSNNFTAKALNMQFGYKVTFECVNKYKIAIPVLRPCYQIFIEYLSEYLNWMSVTDIQLYNTNRYKFFQSPNQLIITNMVKPYSRNLILQNYTPANQTFLSTLCQLNDCWLSICVSILSVFSVGIIVYFVLHIFHLI